MATRRVMRPQRPSYNRRPDRGPSGGGFRITGGQVRVVGLLIVFLIAVLGLGSLLHISTISVTGTRRLSAERVRTLTEQAISTQLFGDTQITLNSGKLRDDLLAGEPALKDVTIKRGWPHTITVGVTERQPSLYWKTGEQVYLLDYDGTIIGPADANGQRLPTVVDSTNLPIHPGDKVVPARFVVFVTELAATLAPKTGLQLTGLRVPDTTSEVYATTSKPYLIKFDTTREAAGEIADLKSVLAELERLHKVPGEYIDLRIENKAYYK